MAVLALTRRSRVRREEQPWEAADAASAILREDAVIITRGMAHPTRRMGR